MKIQNNGLPGSTPLETTRAQPAPPEAGSSAAAGQSISGLDGDSIEISSMSTRVSQANAADSQQRANRVAELAALHSRGGYQVNADNLSGALVSQAVAPGGEA
jgi:anti-sigma28 factor (negative regulator of flagellin synthesis)